MDSIPVLILDCSDVLTPTGAREALDQLCPPAAKMSAEVFLSTLRYGGKLPPMPAVVGIALLRLAAVSQMPEAPVPE